MPTLAKTSLSRRAIMAGSSALTVAISLPALAQTAPAPAAPAGPPPLPPRLPNSFIRIGADSRVTFLLPTSEMGQGIFTGQAQILAEELGVDLANVILEVPKQPANDHRISLFRAMRSVGSYGIRYWHDPLRRAAAQARMMLTAAAAERLGVDAGSLRAEGGHIVHAASGRRIPFGDLVEAAGRVPVPAEIALRPATERTLTGKAIPRVDTMDKITGKAVFGTDVKLDGMLHGAVKLSPVHRAEVESIDDAAARRMPGVVAIAPVPRGAVVIAQSWWQAKQAADALVIRWRATAHDGLDSAGIDRRMRDGLSSAQATPAMARGDAAAALASAARVVEADYAVPFLAHVCMEPLVCTARATPERIEIWSPTQGHDEVRVTLERALQIPADRLFINTTYLGGGFGRKTDGEQAVQAIIASRAVGGRPVKVMWAREDDVRQGHYRQTMMARMRAALDANGRITAMTMRVSGPSMGRMLGIPTPGGVDGFSLGGLVDMRYQAPNVAIDHHIVELPVPMRPWRSIANSFTGFFLESFMDECAHAANQDPIAFRRAHLANQPRHLAVLERAAEMARWSQAPPAGVTRGVALVESYGSPVAEIVELRMNGNTPQVLRVHAAIDCGRAINPGQVEQQIQGSVIEALGAAMRCKITLRQGRAEQSNFSDYPIYRIDEAPEVNVAIVESAGALGGVGEPGVPPLAPALANALHAATGRRVRALPILDHLS